MYVDFCRHRHQCVLYRADKKPCSPHFSGEMQEGFRFIWRDTASKQLASRGQARLPSLSIAESLIRAARRAGRG